MAVLTKGVNDGAAHSSDGGLAVKWLSMALTDEMPPVFKGGDIVETQAISDELAEDTPVLLAFMRRKGWDKLADTVERERAK